jgi:peptidyl-prolyl cis-trans isomerase B (cyclophilin B)
MLARTLVSAIFVVGLAAACERASSSGEAANAPEPAAESADQIAVLTVTDFGEIRIRFFPDKAPGHVRNFKKLAREGFYDGVTFHRIIPGFMIQGGDPNTKDDDPRNDGTGGPGYKIKAEFNETPHRRGIVSMARANDPDSAGSQFFIVVKDSNFLDRKYTVFGEVTSGMEVADKIVEQPRDRRDRPNKNIVIESVRIAEAPEKP